jgi:phosphoserine phosphatase
MTSSRAVELVVFDMDGVIFEGSNFWLDLHHAYGTAEEGIALANRYLDDDYGSLAEAVAGVLWKGRPSATYDVLVADRKYEGGLEELFAYLHSNQITTAILSSGPRRLAERARDDLGINHIRANEVLARGGLLSGEAEIAVPDAEKERVGLDLVRDAGATPASTAFVGDSSSDVGFARLVALPIAYNSSSEELDRVARVRLARGHLAELIPVLERWSSPLDGTE